MKQECPNCKSSIDMHTEVNGEESTPVKGDLSICFKCATLLTFTEDMKLVPMTPEELEAIEKVNPDGYKQLTVTVNAVKTAIADRNKHLN